MDDFGVRRKGIQLAGDAVVKTGTYGDEQIALLHRQVCRFGAVHPQHAQIVGVIRVDSTETFQRAGRWHLRCCDKFAQGWNGLRHAYATADVHHRLFRLGQHLTGLFNFRFRKGIVAFNGREVRFQIAESHLDIFRDINQNRTGTTGVCHVERFCHYARQLFQRLDEEAVFGAGQR